MSTGCPNGQKSVVLTLRTRCRTESASLSADCYKVQTRVPKVQTRVPKVQTRVELLKTLEVDMQCFL